MSTWAPTSASMSLKRTKLHNGWFLDVWLVNGGAM